MTLSKYDSDNQQLLEAITAYQQALRLVSERDPLVRTVRAKIQNNLSEVLRILGKRSGYSQLIEKAAQLDEQAQLESNTCKSDKQCSRIVWVD